MKIRKSSFFLYSMQIRSYFFIIWLTINNFQKKVDKLKFTNVLKVLSFFLMNKIHCWKWKIQKTIGRCFKRPIIIICLQKIVKKFRKRDYGRGSLYTRVNGERRWWKRIISLTALQCSHYAPIMMAHSSTNEGESQCTTGPYTLHLAANNSLWTLRHPANRYAEINDACSWCSSKLHIDRRSPLMFVQIDENIMNLQRYPF